MINYKELYDILGFNNINSSSSEGVVVEALGHLNYSEDDKKQAILFLKSQGWMGGIQAATEQFVPLVQSEPEVTFKSAGPAAEYTQADSNFEPQVKKGNKTLFLYLGIFLSILIIGGGLVFAYTQKIWPFSTAPYTEDNFLTELAEKLAQIKTASYVFSLNMDVVERDNDAGPFVLDESSNASQVRRQYENDSKRTDDAGAIIRRLNEMAGYETYNYEYSSDIETAPVEFSYPETIADIFVNIEQEGKPGYSYNYYKDASVKDPGTGAVYNYRVIDGGNNFELAVNFETDEAIEAVSSSGYGYYADNSEDEESNSTTISGKTAIFTRDSSEYIYMSNEPPKPFLESLRDSLRMVSPDTKISGSVSMASELTDDNLSNWKFNADAKGDFGDLAYKVNIDALKKGEDYYVKINNFPSLFFFDFVPFKGKWLLISPDKLAKDGSYSTFSSLKENMAEMEGKFRDNRQKSIKFSSKAIEIANKTKLLSFKNKPKVEKVGDRRLVRYDLKINKDAVLPFYDELQEAINSDPDLEDYHDSIDQGLIDYLKSDEFNQAFDYFENNNLFVFWTDTDGFPASLRNTLRVVPPDTATQLADKQINIVFEWNIDDINKDIVIEAPSDSVPIDKVIEDYENNLDISESESAPKITEDSQLMKLIRSMRANIEDFWK